MFAYCGNNPIIRIDLSGNFWNIAIGAAIGGASSVVVSAISQYHNSGSVDGWILLVNFASGAVSGGLAATGIGLVGSIAANGAISGGTYLAETIIKNEDISGWELSSSVIFGSISGAIGHWIGSKTNAKTLSDNYKVHKSTIVRESCRPNTNYASKMIAYAEHAIGRIQFEWYRNYLSVIIEAIITALHPTEKEQL